MAVLCFGIAATGGIDPETGRLQGGTGATAGVFVLFLLVIAGGVLYKVLLEGGARGQTLGKMALHIRVRDVLFPLWDSQHQTLHDKVANTIVVPAP